MDTGTIERVLSSLEPADQTTSFAHEPTAEIPMLRALPSRQASETAAAPVPAVVTGTSPVTAPAGKRRAIKHAGRRGPLFKGLPSAPVLLGIAALAVSVGGAVTMTDPGMASNDGHLTRAATALSGSSGTGNVSKRTRVVSRDSARGAQADAAGTELQDAAEGLVEQRNAGLAELAGQAEKRSQFLAKNVWQYPLSPVILTARFGQTGLWSSYHTGLDFNGNTGDPIHAIANGVVISASYDGSYGNKTVVRLDDGTELWYCHQNEFGVSVGDFVTGGEVIGYVGSTGHVTGSHLHVEVHPGGGDAVDPYPALQQHGLFLGSEAMPG